MKNTLCCLMQNRLGALDRVLGALTARGYLPERFMSTLMENQQLQVVLTFDCESEKALEKLIKVLYKQVYVLEIQLVLTEEATNPKTAVITPFERRTPVASHR